MTARVAGAANDHREHDGTFRRGCSCGGFAFGCRASHGATGRQDRAAAKVQGVTAGAVKKPAKPIQRSAASENSRATPAQSREWTLEDALPERSVIMRQYEPVRAPDVGRVPLRSGPGSFGLTTDTQVNPPAPHGRPIPSLESNAQRSSSYVGVSLSADQRQGDEHPAAVCCPTVTTGG